MHANVARFDIHTAKRFLDDACKILKLSRMKNLKMLGALVVLCGMLGSCGIPMASVRTAQNTAKSLVALAANPMNN
jgi:hypothetical protein